VDLLKLPPRQCENIPKDKGLVKSAQNSKGRHGELALEQDADAKKRNPTGPHDQISKFPGEVWYWKTGSYENFQGPKKGGYNDQRRAQTGRPEGQIFWQSRM